MKERQIPFNGPMVRAVLDGSKTQTRRVVKLPHQNPLGSWESFDWGGPNGGRTAQGETVPSQQVIAHTRTGEIISCPHGQPGDRLWVRETWYCDDYRVQDGPYLLPPCETAEEMREVGTLVYCADDAAPYEQDQPVWRPSTNMPRWVSRITLEITAVRVERLQDISETDAIAEGLMYDSNHMGHWSGTGEHWFMGARDAYRNLWKSINGLGSWDANPWVWVVEFKRITA